MKRLFLICFVCSILIGCNKAFTEETMSDLTIKTLSAFEAEVKNPDSDLVTTVSKLCKDVGMDMDKKNSIVGGAENFVIYEIQMVEGPTFQISVEDRDQYTGVWIGFVYPNDSTQGNGIPKKIYNNLISTLASSGMEYYTDYSEPKHINPITLIYSTYQEYGNGVLLNVGTIDKINVNKPEDKFFLTAINALNCLATYLSYGAFETSFKQICENGGLSYDANLSKIETNDIRNPVAYTTKIDNITASITCAESTITNYFGEDRVVIIQLDESKNNSGGSTLHDFSDKLKKLIANQEYFFHDQEVSDENSIMMFYVN